MRRGLAHSRFRPTEVGLPVNATLIQLLTSKPMPVLALANLDDHPLNANVMPAEAFEKLTRHIDGANQCPPLIVRPHPRKELCEQGRFQILDGHHRARALRALGFEQARCEIWDVDDARAVMLLLTLNRLHGEDDPLKRGRLLDGLASEMDIGEMTRWLPEDAAHIEALIQLTRPLTEQELAPPPDVHTMPQAVTFFLDERARARLFNKLAGIADDRSAALVQLLHLESDDE
jgi:hypothetical protein